MARRKEKQPVHHVQMIDGKRAIIQQLLQEYDIEDAQDIQDALKDLLGGTIKEVMEAAKTIKTCVNKIPDNKVAYILS